MTIKKALYLAYKKLIYSPSPQLDADILLSFVLKKSKTYLYINTEKKLTTLQVNKFKKLINLRSKHQPIAYLTNQKEFFGFNFYVDKRVLIPRPETEILIELANKILNAQKIKTIADIGTGSGCIAITLKKINPYIHIFASDISASALQVAKKNSKHLQTKIKFLKGSLLTPYQHKKIDLYIANLPYVSPEIYKQEKSIKAEPKQALVAKNHGLEYIENLIYGIQLLKYKPKYLLLEINPNQYKKIKKISKYLPIKINAYRDLQKKIRILKINYHQSGEKKE
jgi:release factor glutamine methyltransferase